MRPAACSTVAVSTAGEQSMWPWLGMYVYTPVYTSNLTNNAQYLANGARWDLSYCEVY